MEAAFHSIKDHHGGLVEENERYLRRPMVLKRDSDSQRNADIAYGQR